ncbi:MAG: signal peptidase I [Gammaproteobacteria bacterium]|nr:MAG: signal peptidase I [Gammaproteobacteria bacterium]
MNFDFPLFLVLATLITGLVVLADRLWWRPRRAPDAREPVVVEYSRAFFPVILAVLVLRSFVAEPFRIPSGSMMPTLLVGDFILVNKFTYGLRLPVLNVKVVPLHEPRRGDVVVFRYPEDPSVDYIKRVVGLPGDHVSYHGKVLRINGKLMSQEPVGTFIGTGASLPSSGALERIEDLDGVRHRILVHPGALSREGDWVVPPGKYFVMGDNRDNSRDSRYFGFVPEENLIGKAFVIWMNWDPVEHRVTWSRIGTIIE